MRIDIRVEDEGVRRLLGQVRQRLGHLRPAMSLVGEIVLESIHRNFEAGGRPAWKELSQVTIARRKALGKWPGPILMRSGVAGGLLGAIHYRPEEERVTLSVNKKYAALHQFGAEKGSFGAFTFRVRGHLRKLKSGRTARVREHTRTVNLPWGDIPARPFMMVQEEDWDEIQHALARYLIRRM